MKSKVCGITNAEDALLCAESGADFLGFIFYAKSKRYVDAEIAADIVKLLPAGTLKVGVFVNAPADKINAIAEKLKLDYVQLSGDESPDYARTLNTPVIKAFRVGESFDYSVIEKYYGVIPLLDTFAEGAYGGTGKVFSWDTIDLRLAQPRLVQDAAHLLGQFDQVAAVQTDAPDGWAKRRGLAGAFDGVVGVDQVDGRRAQQLLQLAERVHLVGERLHPGMSRGPEHGDAVPEPAERVAGTGAAADVGRPSRQHARLGRMGAPRAEFDHRAAASSLGQPGSLRCDRSKQNQPVNFG